MNTIPAAAAAAPAAGPSTGAAAAERRRIHIRGTVQGVGFRPFVYRVAQELGVSGWVRNDGAGVDIDAQGSPAMLDELVRRLRSEAPGPARVERLLQHRVAAGDAREFRILDSGHSPVRTMIGPDLAVCPQCLSELFDPADRRWRYPFINCTACGPRYTLTSALPYDRSRTAMKAFELCDRCRGEYGDPADRRFHAEPNACPRCGPQLALLDADGTRSSSPQDAGATDALAATLAAIRAGAIVAVKGLGGFHLACDARQAAAVAALRRRKARDEKPFALMVANLASALEWVELGGDEAQWLASAQRPIVLARKKDGADARLGAVAPGLDSLGVMLPYTPLHYLLFHEAAGRPTGTAWLDDAQRLALVMTSANPGGEPLVIDNAEAVHRLHRIADAFLVHDRPILSRCDDSVVQAVDACVGAAAEAGGKAPTLQFIRRSRGYAPAGIAIAPGGPDVLALGAHLKTTVCHTKGERAFLSPHVGDLDSPAACEALVQAAGHLGGLLQARPEAVACDLHPDFFSTRHAHVLAARLSIPLIEVQHHHAHIGAVLAEHGVESPALGLALDGLGLGTDGGIWGGELLQVEGSRMARLGHLAELPQPGADRAAREPWRMAAGALHAIGQHERIAARFNGEPAAATVTRMLARGLNCPPTSSMGRWFDAAAGLLGVARHCAFEGQAAMRLEALAAGAAAQDVAGGTWSIDSRLELDLKPLAARLADETDARRGARCFHMTLVAALADWVEQAARRSGFRRVALGGGCFMNRIVSTALAAALAGRGFAVLQAAAVPPNDGGLSLGQAWIAQRALRSGNYRGAEPCA